MKSSFIRSAGLLSLLAGTVICFGVPEAGAYGGRSSNEVKRCLTGRFRVRLTQTIEEFSDPSWTPLGVTEVDEKGTLQIRPSDPDAFKGVLFKFKSTSVRGRRKVIIRGTARGTYHRPSPLTKEENRGSLKIVIVKRGNRARISEGKFTWAGKHIMTGNIDQVTDGRLTGYKRLPASCR